MECGVPDVSPPVTNTPYGTSYRLSCFYLFFLGNNIFKNSEKKIFDNNDTCSRQDSHLTDTCIIEGPPLEESQRARPRLQHERKARFHSTAWFCTTPLSKHGRTRMEPVLSSPRVPRQKSRLFAGTFSERRGSLQSVAQNRRRDAFYETGIKYTFWRFMFWMTGLHNPKSSKYRSFLQHVFLV